MHIKQILPVDGNWQLVLNNDQAEGAVFRRVAAWALVEEAGETRVTALYSDPDDRSGSLSLALRGDVDVVGLAEPGGGEKEMWRDIVRDVRAADDVQEERESLEYEATKVLEPTVGGGLSEIALIGLRSVTSAALGRGAKVPDQEVFEAERSRVLVALAERGLVTCDGVPRTWVPTRLGRAVLELVEKRKR